MRTFIAFDLPREALSCVKRIQTELKAHKFKVRWAAWTNIHLTLKFLGEIAAQEVGPIARELTGLAAAWEPIEFAVQGLGVFPGIRRPRVIWVGLGGATDKLRHFQEGLESKLHSLGHPKEKRRFKAHLTIGRSKGRIEANKLLKALEECSNFEAVPFTAARLVLYRSDLKPGGAVYTALSEARLQRAVHSLPY
jgi:2'-5' RNA ligase